MVRSRLRLSGVYALFLAVLGVIGLDARVSYADPKCNGQKAVIIGCPIPQTTCKEIGCGTIVRKCETCWEGLELYSNKFGCGPLNITEKVKSNTWLCYQVWGIIVVGGIAIPYPVTADCLKVRYCKANGVFGCIPDANNVQFLGSILYDTTNTCTNGS